MSISTTVFEDESIQGMAVQGAIRMALRSCNKGALTNRCKLVMYHRYKTILTTRCRAYSI